jgi:hypothetical protein
MTSDEEAPTSKEQREADDRLFQHNMKAMELMKEILKLALRRLDVMENDLATTKDDVARAIEKMDGADER